MKIDLTGKNALIGGSSKGIGLGIATELANSGASVCLMARNENKLKEIVDQLPNSENHTYLVVDFSKFCRISLTILLSPYLTLTDDAFICPCFRVADLPSSMVNLCNPFCFQQVRTILCLLINDNTIKCILYEIILIGRTKISFSIHIYVISL